MALAYKNNQLSLGKENHWVSLLDIARTSRRPFYAYDWNEFERRLLTFRNAFTLPTDIHYAMKANSNAVLLKRIAHLALGVDVVSGGEIREALAAEFPADRIIFSGVGKTIAELELAITLEIRQINVESPQELERIGFLARKLRRHARVALRINPDVDPNTHPYITTGFRENKFGMDASFLPQLHAILHKFADCLELKGTTIHIGSQLLELDCIAEAIQKTIPVFQNFRTAGFPIETFDIGGGLGVQYEEDDSEKVLERIENYGAMVSELLGPLGVRVLCEPGRILIGPCGVLVGEVQYVKRTPFKNFLIADTGMHHLLRPALYQAYHRILPLQLFPERSFLRYDVVGPICESSDVLGTNRELQETEQGDFLAIADAGAYGFTMASHYNAHDLPREFLVEDGRYQEI